MGNLRGAGEDPTVCVSIFILGCELQTPNSLNWTLFMYVLIYLLKISLEIQINVLTHVSFKISLTVIYIITVRQTENLG